ncbi:hypothetical protein DSECCO2_318380 [anaerobic digester metagenome]
MYGLPGSEHEKRTEHGRDEGAPVTAARTFARHALETDGYAVVRTASGTRPADQVAWRERELRFILVRRVRQHCPASGVAARFAPEIAALRGFPLPDGFTCTAELWLYHRLEGFRRYRVFRGGFMELHAERTPSRSA